jgi:hypothetical protein
MTENKPGLRYLLRARLQPRLKQRYLLSGLGIVLAASAGIFLFMRYEAPAEVVSKKDSKTETAVTEVINTITLEATAEVTDNTPVLYWSGDFPSGALFQIERSNDGVDFEVLQKAPKEELWNKNGGYRFQDAESEGSNAYYRISYMDAKNEIIASDIVTVSMDGAIKQKLQIRSVEPVPFNEHFTITMDAAKEEIVAFEILDYNGGTAYSEVYVVKPGENIIGFTRGNQLSPGVYIVRITGSDNTVAMTKLIRR